MFYGCAIERAQAKVLRLVATHREPTVIALLRRGVDPESVGVTVEALAGVGMAFSAAEIVDDAFRPKRDKPTPFREGRFGDGTTGVYYSALERKTCEMELKYHVGRKFVKNNRKSVESVRLYRVIDCEYSGMTSDLRGQEDIFANLVSENESGYPFCQGLAVEGMEKGIEGFFTPSARDSGGTCVPVFKRSTLSKESIGSRVTMKVSDNVAFGPE